ncbi:MAG: Redoxin [Pseudomonadota bacterium]
MLFLAWAFWGIAVAPQGGYAQTESKVSCPPIDLAGLKNLLGERPDKSIRLIFFSSWCSDCPVHLKKIKPSDNIVIVGIFDKRQRIEKAVKRLELAQPCFTDAGVGKKLGVTIVPAERTVSAKNLTDLLGSSP